jgi:hypothetical protein
MESTMGPFFGVSRHRPQAASPTEVPSNLLGITRHLRAAHPLAGEGPTSGWVPDGRPFGAGGRGAENQFTSILNK